MSGSNSKNSTLIIALLVVVVLTFSYVVIANTISNSESQDIEELNDLDEEE